MQLGKWAIIDIETTGVSPGEDSVIDLGFLQFADTRLVKTYSSLVRYRGKISQFVQKLTGITPAMLRKAPPWEKTEAVLNELEGHQLLAHYAGFESSFLARYFQPHLASSPVDDAPQATEFQDSLLFLGLLFPERRSLNLESFIQNLHLGHHEVHRGLEDSCDLLKVLLTICGLCQRSADYKLRKDLLISLRSRYHLQDLWASRLLELSEGQLCELAASIEFDLWAAVAAEEQSGDSQPPPSTPKVARNLNFSGKNVKAIWRSKQLPEIFPGHDYRQEQEELSLRIGQSFNHKVHAMIQAPTGTGKTLGHLLPASLFAMAEGESVLVATGTKALQHQIMTKDLPQLRKMLGTNQDQLKACSLVGSQNHLCELLFRQNLAENPLLVDTDFSQRYSLAVMDMVFELNHWQQPELKRGDIAYVLKKINPSLESLEKNIAVDFRACIGKRCPHQNSCTYINGLRKAREADIIVGNHALMLQWPKGLVRPQYIVVDEAHKLEKETSAAFTLELKETDFNQFIHSLEQMQGLGALFSLLSQQEEPQRAAELIEQIKTEARGHAQSLSDHIGPLREVCELYFKQRPRYTSLYWNEAPALKQSQLNNELVQSIYNHLESVRFIVQELHRLIAPYAEKYSPQDIDSENALIAFSRFESFFATLDNYHQCLEQLMQEDDQYSRSFSYHEDWGFSLQSVPIDVGKIVHDELLSHTNSVIFTSATLGNASGDFGVRGVEWPLGHSTLAPNRRYRSALFLPPIYDYQNQAKIFLCDDAPSMHDRDFVPTILEGIIELVKKLEGKSLLLFSAKTRFETAREILLDKMSGQIPLFVQGMGNNVVDDYRKSPQGVLLGMEAFGEGIDLPGKSLQFVLIDKIPDIRQTVATQQRREFFERSFGQEFTDYFLAHRTRSLAQKLGRLLRRKQDIGAAIIVDNRIKRWQARTVQQFYRLMEPYQIDRCSLHRACHEAYTFLSTKQPLGDEKSL